jgi:hypothetical protein
MTSTPPRSLPPEEQRGSHLGEDVLLDLLVGRVPEDRWRLATAHLISCPRCERRFRRRSGELERLRVSPEYQALLKGDGLPGPAAEGSTGESRPASPPREPREMPIHERIWHRLSTAIRWPRYPLGAAAAVAALGALAIFMAHSRRLIPYPSEAEWLPSVSEYTQLRNADPNSVGAGGGSRDPREVEQMQAALSRAVAAYDRRDLPAAISQLRAAKCSGSLETLRQIYLANALLQHRDSEEAVRALRTILQETLPDRWRHECAWMLLIGLDQTRHRAGADSLLKALAAEPGDFGDQARRLLNGNGR